MPGKQKYLREALTPNTVMRNALAGMLITRNEIHAGKTYCYHHVTEIIGTCFHCSVEHRPCSEWDSIRITKAGRDVDALIVEWNRWRDVYLSEEKKLKRNTLDGYRD